MSVSSCSSSIGNLSANFMIKLLTVNALTSYCDLKSMLVFQIPYFVKVIKVRKLIRLGEKR